MHERAILFKRSPLFTLQVGSAEIVQRIVDDLKDENEQYRKMVMETIDKVSVFIFTSCWC